MGPPFFMPAFAVTRITAALPENEEHGCSRLVGKLWPLFLRPQMNLPGLAVWQGHCSP